MRIRKLFPLTFVAVFTVALLPDWAVGQDEPIDPHCMTCDKCPFESDEPGGGGTCVGTSPIYPFPWLPIGLTECEQDEVCQCRAKKLGRCEGFTEMSAAEQDTRLKVTLAAIGTGESIPADGLFFYLRQGADFVVHRKCDAAEVARVAIADVESAPVPGRG